MAGSAAGNESERRINETAGRHSPPPIVMPDRHHHSETQAMQHLSETGRRRNARPCLSPQERAKACLAIHRLIILESLWPDTARRNARLRMAIGLPPFPRRRITKAHARAVQ